MVFKKSHLFLSLSMVSSLFAATPTWTGNVTNFWTNSNNWNPVAFPTTNDTPTFPSVANLYFVDYVGINFSPLFNGMTIDSSTMPYTIATSTVGNNQLQFNNGQTITFNGTVGGTDLGGKLRIFTALNLDSNNAAGTEVSATIVESGPSTIFINGAGLLTLSATNSTYSGFTQVQPNALLAITDSGSLGTSTLKLLDSSFFQIKSSMTFANATVLAGATPPTIFIDPAKTVTYSGLISGGTGFTKDGGGTLILTGTNTYTGDTTVTNGTLAISADANIGTIVTNLNLNNGTTLQASASNSTLSAQHPIFLNGATTFDTNGNTFNISAPISGSGSLTKINPGTLILTGTNSYNGDTIVSAGILQGDTNSIQGDVHNNASVVFDQTFTEVYLGMMDGSGSLTKQNSGTVILAGANTYSGGTTISGGTLQGNTTSLQGSITNDATLVFDQVMPFSVFSGTISGSGSVIKQNAGTLQLTAPQSYTGGTTINGGTLQISTSITGPVTVNAGTFDVESTFTITDFTGAVGSTANIATVQTLTFGTSNSTTFAGNIVGPGGLTKQGSGTVTFSGANTYLGPTQIDEGTLVVNGSSNSPTTVGSDATLKGTGTINAPVIVDGTLRPGNSVGTINVLGPVTFNATSTFTAELNPAQASLLNVTGGGVTIDNATLAIIPDPGTYTVGSTYTIIQTTGGVVTGNFSTVTNSTPLLVFSVHYAPNTVQLSLDKKGAAFSALFPSGNVGAVAACLDKANPTPDTDFNDVFNQLLFTSDVKKLKHALNQMQPSQYNALQLSQENVDTRLLSVLSLRAADLHRACKPQSETWGIWADAFGDFLEQDHQQGQYGFHATTGAALVGFDGYAMDHLHLGFGGAYTWTSLDWAGDHGDGDISSGYGFAYGTWNVRHFFLDASFVGGYNNYEAKRHIDFLAIDRHAKSEHHGYTLAGRLTGGFPFKAWKAEIAPLLSVDYDYVHQTSFKEHGAQSLNLHVHAKNANLLRAEAGFRVTRRCPPVLKTDPCTMKEICVSDARWLPSFQLTVIREWRFEGRRLRSRLEGLDCTFSSRGLNPDRTLIAPAAGITWLVGDFMGLTLDYAGEFDVDGNYWDQKANFQISYAF